MSIILSARTIIGFEQTPEALIHLLQEWGTLATTVICDTCSGIKTLGASPLSIDGYNWRCANPNYKNNKRKRVGCYKGVSLRKNTFFHKSHLHLSQILLFVRYWVTFTEFQNIEIEVDIVRRTVTDWNSFCLEVVVNRCFKDIATIGGPEIVVDLDEHNFVSSKHITGETEDHWFCGGIERERGDFFFWPVKKRDRTTILEMMRKCIRPGTIIKLHCWYTEDLLKEEDYEDLSKNHSITFLDPRDQPKGDPQKVKVLFAASRFTMPKKRINVTGYLARFYFVRKCKYQNLDPTVEFMKAAGELYKSDTPITFEGSDEMEDEQNQEVD